MPFDYQPILRGTIVELRPLRQEDFDALYAVAGDPQLWEQHPDSDRHEEPVFREFFRQAIESGGALVAIDVGSQEVIGSSRYHGYNHERREVEIGWTFLARQYWGGEFNGEMKRLMLVHAFQFVDAVLFLIGPQNLRSQRSVEKLGAVRAGSRTDGSGRESYVFRLTAEHLGANRPAR